MEKLASDFQQYINFPCIQLHSFMKTDDFNMIDLYYSMLTGQNFSLNNNPTTMIYIHVAFSFSNLGFYKQAIQFYEQGISVGKFSIDSPESKVLYLIIDYLYSHLSEYDTARIYIGIVLSCLDETDLLASELFNHIGDVENKDKNEDNALSCYQEALKIANYQDIPSLPNIYRNIIGILKKKRNFQEVSVYEEQAKEIDYNQYHISTLELGKKIFETCKNQLENETNLTPIQRGDLLYKVGLYLMKNNDFQGALTNLLEAKKSFLEEPPSWHRFPRQLPTLFDNIAFAYLFLRDHLKALAMWKKAIDIRNSFCSN
ncbi:unnamed protein product [Rotaria socialis]|nr:unnamed protein product [Rotaria socialis]CAF3574212.1 unnamed protein product [Rotaria socialis]CAF4303012.1 unnamed protein product [Rotaria socialis]CAF4363019.1 unnamed protein product [Rotaria socialis]